MHIMSMAGGTLIRVPYYCVYRNAIRLDFVILDRFERLHHYDTRAEALEALTAMTEDYLADTYSDYLIDCRNWDYPADNLEGYMDNRRQIT